MKVHVVFTYVWAVAHRKNLEALLHVCAEVCAQCSGGTACDNKKQKMSESYHQGLDQNVVPSYSGLLHRIKMKWTT